MKEDTYLMSDAWATARCKRELVQCVSSVGPVKCGTEQLEGWHNVQSCSHRNVKIQS